MKATLLWDSPNSGADNSSGFTALPAGSRGWSDGHFDGAGKYGFWWSATRNEVSIPYVRLLKYDEEVIARYVNPARDGFSVRCIKD